MRGFSWRSHRWTCRFPGRLRHHLVRPEGLGQGAPTRRLSTVHPRHAADHAARHLSDAAAIVDRDGTGLECTCVHSCCTARRVAGVAHLQAALGSAIRDRCPVFAHPGRRRTHLLKDPRHTSRQAEYRFAFASRRTNTRKGERTWIRRCPAAPSWVPQRQSSPRLRFARAQPPSSRWSCVARLKPCPRMRAILLSGTISERSRQPRGEGSRRNSTRADNCFLTFRSARRSCRDRSRWRCREASL